MNKNTEKILANRLEKCYSEEVTTKTEKVLRTENLVRTAIINGVDPQKAYLKYGKF
jgi:4-hydroxy-4-methyl-2-oxoglutarate aldolase